MTLGDNKMQVSVPAAGYHREPSLDSGLETILRYGEVVDVLERGTLFSKIQSPQYSRPGFTETAALRRTIFYTDHRVMKPFVNVYAAADPKSPCLHTLEMNSLLTLRERRETTEGAMLKFDYLGWTYADETMKDSLIAESGYDYVDAATGFVNLTYLWGGLDCSRLVQNVLLPLVKVCGRNCSDLISVGSEVDITTPLKRGDLVFFMQGKSSHVVIMIDGANCVHASMLNRRVLIEPLANVVKAQGKYGTGEISAVRRFPWYKG